MSMRYRNENEYGFLDFLSNAVNHIQQNFEEARLEKERKEQARLEAERREKARLEEERKERCRLEAKRCEEARLEEERKERVRLEAKRREEMRLEQERKERVRLEAKRREEARLEAKHREEMRLEAQKKEQAQILEALASLNRTLQNTGVSIGFPETDEVKIIDNACLNFVRTDYPRFKFRMRHPIFIPYLTIAFPNKCPLGIDLSRCKHGFDCAGFDMFRIFRCLLEISHHKCIIDDDKIDTPVRDKDDIIRTYILTANRFFQLMKNEPEVDDMAVCCEEGIKKLRDSIPELNCGLKQRTKQLNYLDNSIFMLTYNETKRKIEDIQHLVAIGSEQMEQIKLMLQKKSYYELKSA